MIEIYNQPTNQPTNCEEMFITQSLNLFVHRF